MVGRTRVSREVHGEEMRHSARLTVGVALVAVCLLLLPAFGCGGQKTSTDQSTATPSPVLSNSMIVVPENSSRPTEAEAFRDAAGLKPGVTTLDEVKRQLPSGARLEEVNEPLGYHFIFSDGSKIYANFGGVRLPN